MFFKNNGLSSDIWLTKSPFMKSLQAYRLGSHCKKQPAGASSTTRQSSGEKPRFCATFLKQSGAGLPSSTSSPQTTSCKDMSGHLKCTTQPCQQTSCFPICWLAYKQQSNLLSVSEIWTIVDSLGLSTTLENRVDPEPCKSLSVWPEKNCQPPLPGIEGAWKQKLGQKVWLQRLSAGSL